jgi:AraC-like DNA-binding protein
MLPGAEPDALVATGLATVLSSAGSVAIESLARSLGVSRRLLEYRVKARTGMTPKRLSQIVRTREAIRRIRRKPHRPLGAVAAGLGYCDQSHFIREFKATAGSAPTKFFSDDQFVADFCRQA